MIKQETSRRIVYLDILNIAACFCVVWLHSTNAIFSIGISRIWYVCLLFQVLAHWAVPVFFMITGATLLNYREKYTTSTFFKKRFIRVFLPFLIWSILYAVLRVCWGELEISGIGDFFSKLLNNQIIYIFWFFYALFGVYFSIPVVSLLAKEKNKKVINYFLILCVINTAVFPLFSKFFHLEINAALRAPIALEYIGYLLAGWIIKNETWSKPVRYTVYASGIAGALLMFFGTIFLTKSGGGSLDIFFMGYFSVSCYPMSFAVFLLAKHIPWNRLVKPDGKLQKAIQQVAGASFGSYLIQMVVFHYEQALFSLNPASKWYISIWAVFTYLISLLLVLCLKKIPLIGKLLFP